MAQKLSQSHKDAISKSMKIANSRTWLLGRKLTKEHKDKIAISSKKAGNGKWMKGRKLTREHKEAIARSLVVSNHWKGKNLSEEHRKKLSISHKGHVPHPLTPEGLEKLRGIRKGNKCNFWKGGLVEKHRLLRRSSEYRAWRKAVFVRDNYTCIWCGMRGVELCPDHIKPFSLFPELRLDINNGRTLCHPCHKKTDTYGLKIRKYALQNK